MRKGNEKQAAVKENHDGERAGDGGESDGDEEGRIRTAMGDVEQRSKPMGWQEHGQGPKTRKGQQRTGPTANGAESKRGRKQTGPTANGADKEKHDAAMNGNWEKEQRSKQMRRQETMKGNEKQAAVEENQNRKQAGDGGESEGDEE